MTTTVKMPAWKEEILKGPTPGERTIGNHEILKEENQSSSERR